MRTPNHSPRARAPRVALALALALALCSSLIPPRGVVATETESWHAPVCGARAAATCVSSLSAWERDVHALQALHHHCGVDESGNRAPAWDDEWGEVASFSGSRDAWDALCETSNAWLAKDVASSSPIVTCDWMGRVISVNVDGDRHGIKLDCEHGLPTEFESLSELVALRVAGALTHTVSGAEISEIMHPLASLRRIAVVSLPSNGLLGRVPDVCDTHTGYAFDSALERLELSDNKLTGALSGDGLKCATNLRIFDASYNDLSGSLPDDWADSLHQLRVLKFNDNPRLTGVLPTAWFPPLSDDESNQSGITGADYRLGNLVELDGGDCDLTGGLPANLGGASFLETLKLGGNRIEGSVPGSVTRLTQLRELNLRRNKLSGLLPANLFTELANTLKTVDLAHNAFTGSPPPFPESGYPVLRHVDLSENDFEGAFPSFGAVSLLFLSLAHNGFTGAFPDPCRNGFLDHLEIQGNNFAGAFPDISCLFQLTVLDASKNAFESLAGDGAWIARTRIRDISFRSNALSGSLPSSGICGPYTRRIDLSGNAFLGAIPESVGECISLRELRLGEFVDLDDSGDANDSNDSENDESSSDAFSLPSEATLAKLTRLTHLHLRGLGLEGAIPRSLFALPSLLELDLSHNRLSGALPGDAENFSWSNTLHRLSLARNNLTSVVPSSLLKLKSLQKLYLARNSFEGVDAFPEPPPLTNDADAGDDSGGANETDTQTETEPEEPELFSFAAHLDRLDLSSNALQIFPAALERVEGLTMLSLANNYITGVVPAWLGKRDTLVHLRLDSNELHGSLEDWLGDNRLLDLESLRVDGNKGITGPLSSKAIRPMARLKRLNVSAIDEFGAFPHALGIPGASLDSLTHLHARKSGLNGTLPLNLFAALPNLRLLDLRENKLTGDVPDGERETSNNNSPSEAHGALRFHTSLETLLLANNSFTGFLPRLSLAMELNAEERKNAFGLTHMRDAVVDLRGAGDETNGSFICPLPLDAAAYNDAECTCPAGSAGLDKGRFECDLCLPGRYSAEPGAPACDVCPVGGFAENAGSVACDLCVPGTAAPAVGSATCQKCAPGFFAALSGSPTCDACDPGTFSMEEGSVKCNPCPLGAAAEEPASASCITCAPGTFAAEPKHDGVGSHMCVNCAAGTFSEEEGSTVCLACLPGHVSRTEGLSTCVKCDEGSFASVSGLSDCALCAAGSFASTKGATSCDACVSGTFSAAEGKATCDACPVGTFGPEEGKASCDSCPIGTFADTEGSTVCLKCAKGAFADAPGHATCEKCAPGAFQENEGASTCVACAAGTFADSEGSESCDQCPLGTFADEIGLKQCVSCAVGSFANEEGAELCAPCPAGSAAANEASAACSLCAPGTFANETGAETCASCPVGTVSSGAASSTCELCPAGSFSDQKGLTKCQPCLPGSSAGEGAGSCVNCGVGFFASEASSNTCSACPKGTFQNATGQYGCVTCPAGTASSIEGAGDSATCVSCPAGTSTDGKEAMATCADCDAGAYASSGAESCALASPGAVASVAGAAEQTLCPPGTHAPGRGNTECLLCPENHAAPTSGSATCHSCPYGSEAEEGAAFCVCSMGYRDATDLFASSDLVDFEESSVGSDASMTSSLLTPVCLACEPGTYGDGVHRCVTCPPDAFASSNATQACQKIAPGHVGSDFVEPTAMRGARAQTPCPAGSRSRDALVGLALVPQCEACPEGTVAPVEGSDTCAACAPGFEPDATRTVCVGQGGGENGSNGANGSNGSSSGSEDYSDYAGLSDDALAALTSNENDSATKGAMSAKTSAAAFFALLGVCALSLFFMLRWWRARNARLRRLAFEREMALDAAEEDIAETGKIRRSTLFALANVDAEATAYGEDLGEKSRGDEGKHDRDFERRRFFSPFARLNPFGGFSRDRSDEKKSSRSRKRGASRYSAARVARAASGVLPLDAHPRASARMSVARARVDRLDRLERLSRFRGASRALPRRGSRLEPGRRHLGVSDDSDSDTDACERLKDAPAFSDDRSQDDEEAAFESALLAAARRASRFERDRRDRRRDESQRETRRSAVLRDDDDDDQTRDDRRRLLDAPSRGSGDRPDGGGAADASAHAALLSDVIVETAERGEAAKRRWKMFGGNGDGKP